MSAPSPADSRPVDLYHLACSHYCEKARRILEYKKIPFRLVNVPYHDHEEVLRLSGQDYVPLLHTADGANVLWSAIPDWAEALVPTPTLYPAGRAIARMLDHWAHNVIEESVWQLVVPRMPATFADSQERWIFEELQMRKRGPLEYVAMRRDDILAALCTQLALPEEALGGSAWLQGDAPSLADFALYSCLRPLEMAGEEIPPQFPRLREWYARVAVI